MCQVVRLYNVEIPVMSGEVAYCSVVWVFSIMCSDLLIIPEIS